MNINAGFNAARSRGFVSWLLLILVFVVCVRAERLPVKTYTVADGLLRDYVYKIKQDSRGFIWFCTPGGLSRFDGYGFTNFTVTDGLPDQRVNDFLETKRGNILIATDKGLAGLNPKGIAGSAQAPLFFTSLPADAKARKILNLFERETGQIYAGTSDGLYRISESDGKFDFETVELPPLSNESLEVTSMISDRGGALWVGTFQHGLYRISANGEVDQFTTKHGLPTNRIESLLQDKNGRIWVGMRAGLAAGLCLLVSDQQKDETVVERVFTEKDGLPSEWILAIGQARDGEMWVATIRGLCKWQGGYGETNSASVCKTYTAKNDLCDTDIWSLNEDKDGNLWTGTRCGLKRLARYGFTTYTVADGVDAPYINSIFEDVGGDVVASFDPGVTRTVSRFNGEAFDMVKPRFPANIAYFGWGTRQTVWQYRTGDWLFPSSNGLYKFSKPARFEDLATSIPQKIWPVSGTTEIFRLFEDSRGGLWMATTGNRNGIWQWESKTNSWFDYSAETGIGGTDLLGSAIAEDKSGNIWISTSSIESRPTLIRYRDGVFRIFAEPDGLPEGPASDLFVDHGGNLWIAHSTGLLRLNDVNADRVDYTRYSTAEGLSTPGAGCITEDEFGRIYVCTGRGLDRLDPATGQIQNFTTADGLPNSYPQMAFRDRHHRLWFGTSDGIARYSPEPVRERERPNALITGLRVAGVARFVSILGETEIAPIELDASQRQIAVDFLGLGSNPGEKLKYEYRIGGSDWIPTAERTVNFADLGSGSYKFELRVLTADGLYSPLATVAFSIASPLWQRWWFIGGSLIAAITLSYFFYRYRLQRLLDLERIRTRIATDLHDDIGANLTRIALLSEVANQEMKAGTGNGRRELLPSIADIARESVASMNDIVWAISPQHDSLLDLTRRMRQHAEEVFTLRDIDLEFNAPSTDNELRLSVGIRRDLLLIFKEAVNNAAKHSACTRVRIDLSCERSHLRLVIKDDGSGFVSDTLSDGQGLNSMARRAAAQGGTLRIESDRGDGTTVEFELVLPRNTNF